MGKGRGKSRIPIGKPVRYIQGSVKTQKSTSTESGGNEDKSKEPFVTSSGPSVPAEKSKIEIITSFFQSWGNWVAWFGFVVIFAVSYANFNSDVSNSKSDIIDLKDKFQANTSSIVNIEKESIKLEGEVRFLRDRASSVREDIIRIEDNLKQVELEQARSHTLRSR